MSLQPLETPPLRVSRPVAACSRCRNAKIKCDGKLPACTSCEKNGRAAECTSTNDQFARGKERSYVSTLETRIDKLDAKIKEAQARKPSVVSMHENETPIASRRPSEQMLSSQRRPPPQEDEVPTPTTGRRRKRREVSAIDDLVSDFGFLSVNATARDFHGFTQAMSYARLIMWSCAKDELPEGNSKAFPSRGDGMALLEFYLSNVFALLPAFDEAYLWAAFDNVYSRGARPSTAFDHYVLRMIFAIANASMSRRSGDQHYLESISHVCAALEYSEQVLHPGNISGVQAILLLAEYAMLSPHNFDSWQLIGAASRAMTDLGYHQDPPRGAQMDRSRLELRRKVFYCIYVLDRSTSLVQTRAFSFSDASASVKVPFGKQQAKTSISSEASAPSPNQTWLQLYEQASDLVSLRKLQSEWYTELFQTTRETWDEPYPELWRFCNEMKRWFENLSPSTPQHMRHFFELDLLYSYVYVLSPSSRVPQIHQFAQKLIFEYCIHYTDLMLHLIGDSAYTAPLTFYDAMRVYMTGRQFIDVLSHSMDLLLSGAVPPHPEVKPSAPPPPAMPVVPLPPGDTLPRFNTFRAVNCIKQTMECMKRFGSRWGYMSWHQRYEHETKPMLDNLEQRLHVLEQTNQARRVSVWGSNGSISSSNGTIPSYYSPPQSLVHGSITYQQPPHVPPKQPSYGDSAMPQQTSPPLYQQQPPMQPRQQYPVMQGPVYVQTQPQYQQNPPPGQPISFNNPTYRQPSVPTAPGQQFAAWGGYSTSSGPDTLDEETANLWRTTTNESSRSLISPRASRGSLRQPPPYRQSTYVASFEPLPRSSIAQDPGHMSVDENMPPSQRPSSQYFDLQIPPTANLPMLSGTRPTYDPTMPPPPLPPRRTSMQDASADILRTTYPSALPVPSQDPIARQPSPRLYSRARMRRDKGKEKDLGIYFTAPSGGEVVGRCRWKPDLGYVCDICSRITMNPSQHHSKLDGSGCIDFSGFDAPIAHEVHADAGRDLQGALARAEATRLSLDTFQRQQFAARQEFAALQQGQGHEVMLPDYGQGMQGARQARSGQHSGAPGSARPESSMAAHHGLTTAPPEWQGQGQGQQQGSMSHGAGAGMFF